MNLIFQLLYLSSFVTPVLAPILYRNKRPSMIAFYRNMATRPTFRGLYLRMIVLYLITFHFYHLSVYSQPLWLLPSTVLTGLLFSTRIFDKLLHRLHHRRPLVTLFCVGFLTLPMPELLPLGFTLLVAGIAAVFYPGGQLTNSMFYLDNRKVFLYSTDGEIVNRYFSWPEWNKETGKDTSADKGNVGNRPLPLKERCSNAIEDADVIEFIDDGSSK